MNKKLPINKDFVGVGLLSDGSPVVMKNYHKKSGYIKMTKQIQNTIDLMEFTNKSLNPSCKQYAALGGITVLVKEQVDSIYLELLCKNDGLVCGFQGIANNKGAGYYSFLKQYQKLKNITLVITCLKTNDEMHIFGISSKLNQVEVKLLNHKVLH